MIVLVNDNRIGQSFFKEFGKVDFPLCVLPTVRIANLFIRILLFYLYEKYFQTLFYLLIRYYVASNIKST